MPYVSFVESAGADLRVETGGGRPQGADRPLRRERSLLLRDDRAVEAAASRRCAWCSARRRPGGAYQPGLSDYNIVVKEQSKIFLAGPPLVKMATGEESDDETLGGAQLHAEVSGLGDYFAEDEMDAIRICREVVSHLNWRKPGPHAGRRASSEPLHDPEELLGLVSRDLRQPVDVRDVIARVVDGSRFEEFKPRYGPHARVRLGVDPRLPGRHPRQQRRALPGVGREGRALHPAVQPDRRAAALPAEHHRLHGGPRLRGRGHHQEGLADAQRRHQLDGPAPHGDHRLVLRRRHLRHVGPGLRQPLHLPVAHGQDRGDGPEADRRRDVDRAARARRRARARRSTRRRTPRSSPLVEAVQEQGSLALVATGAISDDGIIDPARHAHGARAVPVGGRATVPVEGAAGYGVFRL